MKPHQLAFVLGIGAASLPAQYPANAAQNLSVADRTGEQVVNKIAVTSDGGCYIGWFDHASGSYQVWLQRLDALGNEQWAHNGILVSNNPQSTSLVDWDLICDSSDCCVLAFTDTRAGSDLDVYAYRIDPSGTMLWGANGVALSNNSDYEANPRICEATNGDFVFVWPNGGVGDLRVQRLDAAGNPLYAANGMIVPPDSGALPGWARVCAADNGGFILSWVRTMSFTGNKHVHAQKYDALGAPLWGGGTRLPVFDLTSLPMAHEPRLLADGAGGAVIAWHYAVGQAFSVRVQHLDTSGTELYPHNGVDVCPNTDSKFDPAIALDTSTQDVFVCWNERNQLQSTWGICAQKVDLLGALQWGPYGTTLIPINTTVKYAPVVVRVADGIVCSVLEESLGGLNDKLLSMRLDAQGTMLWQPPVEACNYASDKLRLVNAVSTSGVTLLAWTDARADAGNVLAQNVNPDGTLGDHFATVSAYGCGVNPANSLVLSSRPAIRAHLEMLVDNPLGTQSANSVAAVALALQPDPNFPCGTALPGFGMNGPGELLVSGSLQWFVGGFWSGPGQPVAIPVVVPQSIALAGVNAYLQGLLVDPAPGAAVPFGLTNGLQLTLGF